MLISSVKLLKLISFQMNVIITSICESLINVVKYVTINIFSNCFFFISDYIWSHTSEEKDWLLFQFFIVVIILCSEKNGSYGEKELLSCVFLSRNEKHVLFRFEIQLPSLTNNPSENTIKALRIPWNYHSTWFLVFSTPIKARQGYFCA